MDVSYRSLSEIPIKDLVRICQIDVTTARRWHRGSNLPPPYVLLYLNAVLLGDLGFIDPAWQGWKLLHGHLYSPESWRISMSDVLASRLHEAQLAAWRHEVQRMKIELANATLNRLEEQPTPDQWDVEILAG
jgi:hypothetical protein